MNSDKTKNQQGTAPPTSSLEEGQPINYNITVNNYFIDGNLYKTEIEEATMTDNSRHETTNTTVQAEKMEGQFAIGKNNKASSLKIDGTKLVAIILGITVSLLLLFALYTFVTTGGKTNAFPDLLQFFKGLLSNSG